MEKHREKITKNHKLGDVINVIDVDRVKNNKLTVIINR